MSPVERGKVWLIAVDMGYGHQRAAYPFLPFARENRILTANNYEDIPPSDRKIWERSENFYNFISRLKGKGWLGEAAFRAFDYFQGIDDFYPVHDQSRSTMQLRQIYVRIKSGWGRHLIEKLLREPLPILTTYFVVAHMAEYWNYPAPIYAVVTDSDIPRAWAPWDSKESKIVYLASTERAAKRLECYGVNPERIVLTGFPLPAELVGEKEAVAKEALAKRIQRLDPARMFEKRAAGYVYQYAGEAPFKRARKKEPVAITLAVGGAGAQAEIIERIVRNLASLVKQQKISLNLVAGVSPEIGKRFRRAIDKAGLETALGSSVLVLQSGNKAEYFRTFNETLLRTDILWTKPSELSFYAALGIPLLLMPPVGAHEIRNKEWLLDLGAAIDGSAPGISEWLPEFLQNGRFAEAAMNGFAKMERNGAEHVRKLVFKKAAA